MSEDIKVDNTKGDPNIKHYFGADAYIREGLLLAGQKIVKHIHTYDHHSILALGTVVVNAGGDMSVHTGPTVIMIKKGIEHSVLALTPAMWYCIHGSTGEIDDLDGVHIE